MKPIKTFITTLVIVLILGIGFLFVRSRLMDPSSKEVETESEAQNTQAENNTSNPILDAISPMIEGVVIEQMENYGISEEQAKEFIGSIEEEDKQAITGIAANHITNITQVAGYLANQDTEGLSDYLDENLTEEEKEKIENIISKYMP